MGRKKQGSKHLEDAKVYNKEKKKKEKGEKNNQQLKRDWIFNDRVLDKRLKYLYHLFNLNFIAMKFNIYLLLPLSSLWLAHIYGSLKYV